MRLTILGGGGFRVPLVYEAVAVGATGLVVDEVVLQDVDPQRLATMGQVIEGLRAELAAQGRLVHAPRIRTTTDLADAVTGADFVFSAVRVGGAEGRTVDERVALDLGVLGQETVGPGGLAYALRTIPVVREIARTIAERAPQAWTISFTNPAGIVTEAMREFLGERVVGICDTPIGLVRRVGRLLGEDLVGAGRAGAASGTGIDYVGLNHLGWLRAVTVDGHDRLPGLLADDAALDQIEEARLIGPDWVRADGALPNEYLYYYLHTERAIARIRESRQTRGEFLAQQQGGFYERAACCSTPLELWQETLHEREATYMAESRDEERREEDIAGGGYQEVALRLMSAIVLDRPERMILNVGNARIVPELPADAVIEVLCTVDGTGVHPHPVAPVELPRLGLMAALRGSERAVARAAVTGSADDAWEGFSLHPLVRDPVIGRKLLEGYIAGHASIAHILRR